MTTTVIVDTGPLVALVNVRDRYHAWAKEQFGALRPPLWTCDVVLAEACHLVRGALEGPRAILAMLSRDLLTSAFRLDEQAEAVARLIARYADVPMDLADACIVRISESCEAPLVMTLDKDFLVYRRHGRQRIPTLMPSR